MPDKPPLTPERMQLLICVSNRLLMALGMLMALLIPDALLTYWFGAVIVGAVPMMTLLIGALGGFVGLQKRLGQLADEDLTLLSKSWVYTFLSPLVGGILATLTYVLFISGLLTGGPLSQVRLRPAAVRRARDRGPVQHSRRSDGLCKTDLLVLPRGLLGTFRHGHSRPF